MMQKIKLVCFDLNETLIKENTWYDLNMAMGVSEEEDKLLYDQYHSGLLSYHSWLDNLLSIYKERGDPTREKVEKVVFNYRYLAGAKTAVEYLKDKGYKVVLVSAAMDILVKRVADDLVMDDWAANNIMVFDDSEKLIDVEIIDDEADFKVTALQKICKKFNVGTRECACVGDGMNDRLIFQLCGHGIAFRNSVAEKYAWKTIDGLVDTKDIL